jgi:hypothetical protein
VHATSALRELVAAEERFNAIPGRFAQVYNAAVFENVNSWECLVILAAAVVLAVLIVGYRRRRNRP